jgi:hypothetical protein
MDAFSNIGKFFGSDAGQGLLKAGEVGATGAGLIGNILNERQRSGELDYLKKQQAALADPTKLAQEVAAATQPLNRGLVQSVGNTVSADLAEKGLAEAPGIQATVLSQSLAPFEQANQNTALQLVMQRLGLPISYAQTLLAGLPPNVNLAPLLALLNKGGTPSGNNGGMDLSALTKLYSSAQMPGQTTTPSALPDWLPTTSTGDANVPSDVYA